MAESESIDCPCSNIAIMQLFHELKQSYPKVPDQKVSKIIQENYHDKTACETILQQESHAYLQSYPGAIISGNSRDGLERESICSQCPASRPFPQRNSAQLQCDMPHERARPTRQEKNAFLNSEDSSIYSLKKSENEDSLTGEAESRNSKEDKKSEAACVSLQKTLVAKPKTTLKSLPEKTGSATSAEAQKIFNKAENGSPLREFPSESSAGVGVTGTTECCGSDSSNCSRTSCECDNGRKPENLERSHSAAGPKSFKGTVGYSDAGSVSWNVEDGGRSSGGAMGFIGSPHSSGDMQVHNYQVAVQYSMQPALPLHQGGQQRSFTTVNLSLRPPSSDPQPPIEIRSGQNLTYTTSVYDAKKGVQSQLQIRIGSGGGGTVSACRTYISSPQTRFCCRSPYCTPHTSSGFRCQNNHRLKALLEKQRERKEVLAKELRKEKEKLSSMQNEVRLMKASIARKPSAHLLSKLKSEIEKLRAECERLTAAVDLYSDTQNLLPLGETDEEFYRNIYTGQTLQREGNWSCRLCTFRNHPLLSVCEECEMPRILLGTQVMDVTTHLSVLSNSNSSCCSGGGTSTSASLITAPLQDVTENAMFRSKVRIHTCKIILLTSLVWFLVDVVVITFFSDCVGSSGWNCVSDKNGAGKEIPVQASSAAGSKKRGVLYEKLLDRGKSKRSYLVNELKSWEPAKPVPPQLGGVGEMGQPVRIDSEEENTMKEMFKINQFNLLASKRISLNRSLPDVRAEGCKAKEYQEMLPTTSIVIVFHNEAWSTLLRTVWSVINRSPRPLIKEIILVDDASEQPHLGQKLENYVEKLPVPVYVLRMPKRSGLIRARLLGAKHVKGQIITFLDAHCECTEGWLEPLLSRITEDRRTVVCPIIDVISDETFEYITASDTTWGGFNWRLNFRWYRVPKREMERRSNDKTAPIRTPTMAGGLFSIDKEYFYELGAYDEGMDIWGGENLEMSFRVWQCGGTLEIIPCSHVGHVFRDKSPYTFPGGVSKIVLHNANRVAEVWMDEWRDFYYAMNPGAKNVEVGDISDRLELRKRLKCKSFRWYLTNIYPESTMPLDYYFLGDIKNVETEQCLDTMGHKSGENLGMSYCHGLGGNQVFSYTKRQQITADDNCLDAATVRGPVKLVRCHGMGGNQEWMYFNDSLELKHVHTGQCLERPVNGEPTPQLRPCNGSRGQKWIMSSHFKWQASGTRTS